MSQGPGKDVNVITNEILSIIKDPATLKQKFASGMLRGMDGFNKFNTKFIDKFNTAKRIQNSLFEIKGSPLTDEEMLLTKFRTNRSRGLGTAEQELKTMFGKDGIMRAYDDVEDVLKAKLIAEDLHERGLVWFRKLDAEYQAGWLAGEVEGKRMQEQANAASNSYNAGKAADKAGPHPHDAMKDAMKGVNTDDLKVLEK